MRRLPIDRFTWPWRDSDPCPCGKPFKYGTCCKTGNLQLPFVQMPDITPPGGIEGYAHPKCYMAATNNCSRTISREHWVSDTILQQFERLKITGAPFLPRGESKVLPINALASNILCKRHNSALSPLDALASHAFRCFVEAPAFAIKKGPAKAAHFLASGQALEIWMVKTLAGVFHAGIASSKGIPAKRALLLPDELILPALSGTPLPAGTGLYLTQGEGEMPKRQISIALLHDDRTNVCAGVTVNFGTVKFQTLLTPPPGTALSNARLMERRRPTFVDFKGEHRDARVVLTWPGTRFEHRRLAIEIR